MTSDVAKAIGWAHEHAVEIGGDPSSVYVMGNSAGAHPAGAHPAGAHPAGAFDGASLHR